MMFDGLLVSTSTIFGPLTKLMFIEALNKLLIHNPSTLELEDPNPC